MRTLVKAVDDTGARARADRSLQSGRVLVVDKHSHSAIIDVGMVDSLGVPVYLESVPFSPQNPPQPNDTVAILRTSSSPYSMTVGSGAQVGGANSGQVVQNGGVTSLAKSGSAQLVNAVTLTGTGGTVLTQAGQNIDIASPAAAASATEVGSAVVVGISSLYARQDHVHKGVHSIAKHGGTQLFGDVTFAEGTNVTISVAGNELTINSSGGGGGGGSVTIVGLSTDASYLAVANSPITTSGTITLNKVTGLTANQVVATPNGATGAADLRALVAADIPTLALTKLANIADQTILGNNSGGAGPVLALSAGQVRTVLSLVIGTDVQAWDADLDALAGLTTASNKIPRFTGSHTADLLSFDTDGTLAGNSDTAIASQKAVKTYAQPLDSDLTTIAGLTATTDNFLQAKSSAWASRTPTQVTADLIAVVGDSGSGGTKGLVPAPGVGDAAAGKYLKADGTFAVPSGTGAPTDAHYLTSQAESGLSAEVNLGALTTGLLFGTVSAGVSTITSKVIGTDVQAHDADLDTIAGLTATTDNFLQAKSSAWASRTPAQVAVDLQGTTSTTLAAGNDSRFTTIAGNNQTGTTYTFVLTDAGKVVEGNNGSAITFTIPPISSVAWLVGTIIEVFQQGAGQITPVAGAGVTLRSDGGKVKTAAQYATIGLRMRANDEWVLSGDLA